MFEKKILISVDSYKRDNANGYDVLKDVLSLSEAHDIVGGLHLPAHVLEDMYHLDELWHLYHGKDRAIDGLRLLGDISLSGSTDASCKQLARIRSHARGEKLDIVINHGMSNMAVESVIKRTIGSGSFSFHLTGVLPEDFTDDSNIDNVKKSFGKDPEEFTEHVINRIHNINKNLGFVGVSGVYGSARYAGIDRGDLLFTGVGISYDGEPYESEGVSKHSTTIEEAIETCDVVSVGNIVTGHPDGPLIGFKELARHI